MAGLRILPAEFPPIWAAVLRAEHAAAYLGFLDTSALRQGVIKGQAPPPHDRRGNKPIWYLALCDGWLAARAGTTVASARIDIADLI